MLHDLTSSNTDGYGEYAMYIRNQIGSTNVQKQINVLLAIFGSSPVLCTTTVRSKV